MSSAAVPALARLAAIVVLLAGCATGRCPGIPISEALSAESDDIPVDMALLQRRSRLRFGGYVVTDVQQVRGPGAFKARPPLSAETTSRDSAAYRFAIVGNGLKHLARVEIAFSRRGLAWSERTSRSTENVFILDQTTRAIATIVVGGDTTLAWHVEWAWRVGRQVAGGCEYSASVTSAHQTYEVRPEPLVSADGAACGFGGGAAEGFYLLDGDRPVAAVQVAAKGVMGRDQLDVVARRVPPRERLDLGAILSVLLMQGIPSPVSE